MIFKKRADKIVNKTGVKITKCEVIPNHSEKELKRHYAGAFVVNPEVLRYGVSVTVFQKGSEHWWEHGEITKGSYNNKHVNCYDGTFEFNEVEVYLDSRYN